MHALAITEQGARVHLEAETLLVSREGQPVRRVRLAELNQLLLFGQVEITSAAVAALARRRVDVVFLTQHGSFRARLEGRGSPAVSLRLAQLSRAADPTFCSAVAGAFVAAKVAHQRQVLLRAQRRLQDAEVADAVARMRLLGDECQRGPGLDRLRGLEGQASALYFGQFGKLILEPGFAFTTRNRRPPRDPVNSCLSFGYALLAATVEAEISRRGLEPALGYFHQPHPGRPSLALDLVEEFRPFVDGLVLRLINRRQLGPADFARRLAEPEGDEDEADPAAEPPVEGVYLDGTGRRVFVSEYYGRLRERLHYPPRSATFELRDIIREQVRLLARVTEGTETDYRGFVPA